MFYVGFIGFQPTGRTKEETLRPQALLLGSLAAFLFLITSFQSTFDMDRLI